MVVIVVIRGGGDLIKLDNGYNRLKEVKPVEFDGLWIRGLDVTRKYILVGGSIVKKRQNRNKFYSGKLWLLNHDLKIMKEINVPNIGQVNDLRILDNSMSHNNIIFNLEE